MNEYKFEIKMVWCGSDKGNLPYLKQLINRECLDQAIIIPGFLPSDDLKTIYRNAFALTYVTHFGPDNLPPLEAFALNCPVIASNVHSAEEQLGEAALFINPCNPKEIADAVIKLKNDPELKTQMIKKGKDRSQKWTADDYIHELFKIFDEFEPFRLCWRNSKHN